MSSSLELATRTSYETATCRLLQQSLCSATGAMVALVVVVVCVGYINWLNQISGPEEWLCRGRGRGVLITDDTKQFKFTV